MKKARKKKVTKSEKGISTHTLLILLGEQT